MSKAGNRKRSSASRVFAVTAAAAATFGAVTAANTAPAGAAPDTWAAMAYSPYDRVYGFAGGQPTLEAATGAAARGCSDNGGSFCQIVGNVQNGCLALATVPGAHDDTPDPFYVATGPTPQEALARAEAGLPTTEGEMYTQQCSADQAPVSGGRKLPAFLPPREITVTWKEYIGGIRATVIITNNEFSTDCVYKDEVASRPFTVNKSEPAHIDIPGLPQFRFWPVTVTCDNGMKYEGGTTY